MANATDVRRRGRLMPRPVGPSAPRRQARSVRNDDRILDAALTLADRDGWRSLTVARVAEAAGLSRPTVLARFDDRPSIAVGLWSTLLAEPLVGALERVVRACSPGAALSGETLWSVLEPFAYPSRELRVAAELLIVGRYEPSVGAAIASSLVPELDRWLDARQTADGGLGAAVRAYACNLALGLLVEVRRHPAEGLEFSVEMTNMAAALANPTRPVALPAANARQLDQVANFDTGDDDVNDLLRATLEQVANYGYEAATVGHIAADTQRTTGFIFSRYASKRELFLDANRKYTEVASSLNEAFMQTLAEESRASLAEAVMTRELMRPERRTVMTLSLEVYRLSWHDPEVLHAVDSGYADVIAMHAAQLPDMSPGQHQAWLLMELARGSGPLVLGGLSDTAWNLPFDVVTVPLIDGVHPG